MIFQDCLNGGVADALDEIMPLINEEGVHQRADHQHANGVAQIRILNLREGVLGENQTADEGGGRKTDDAAEQSE